MERYIETFFRFKWMFVLVMVVVIASGFGYAFKQRQILYQSTATVWADKPAYLDIASSSWNSYLTPAENQAGNVQQFLQTNSFALDILAQTNLRVNLSSLASSNTTLDEFRKRVAVYPSGTNLLTISYSDERPQTATQVVQAIITTFNQEVLSSATAQNSVALAFYQKKLQDATAQETSATAALRTYLDAHPELLAGTDTSSQAQLSSLVASASLTAQHPELVKLVQDQQTYLKQEQDYQDQVTQIQFSQSSQSIGTAQSFRIMDPPSTPLKSQSSLKALALQLGLALVAALGFTVLGVIVLTLLDSAARSAQMTSRRSNAPVVGLVPLLKERRSWLRRNRVRRRNVLALLALEAYMPGESE